MTNDTIMQELYVNRIQQMAMLLNPWELVLLIGRGAGKSPVQAYRFYRVVTEMPRCTLALAGPTYVNLMERTVPPLLRYLQEHYGWREDVHYVVGKRPPESWPKPLIPVLEYKHTICTYTGAVAYLGSLDRPGILNSLSLQYYSLDEARFNDYERLTKDLMPAVRGDRLAFKDCPLLYGRTITSDLPYLEDKADWLYQIESRMDKEQIKLLYGLSAKVNELHKMVISSEDEAETERLMKRIAYWNNRANIVRRHSTFFAITSSLVNIDVLGVDYFKNNSDPDINPKHVFRTSFLSIKPLSVEEMFYGQLKAKHFYRAAYNYDYVDQFYIKHGVNSKKQLNCNRDTDVRLDLPLYLGLDFGNMNSLPVTQYHDAGSNPNVQSELRIIKEFYVLIPSKLDDLAKDFAEYYEPMTKKQLHLYYDRAGNNKLANSRKTYAEHFRDALTAYGWTVWLESRGWGNIPHESKHILINDILSEEKPEQYPIIRINEDNCPCLKSSLNLAPAEKYKGMVRKNKKSEKLPLQRLPRESTNLSDAFDYVVWGLFRQLLKHKKGSGSSGLVIGNKKI